MEMACPHLRHLPALARAALSGSGTGRLAPDRLMGGTRLEARRGIFLKMEMYRQSEQGIQPRGFKPLNLSCWAARCVKDAGLPST